MPIRFQPDPDGAVTHRLAEFVHATSWRDIPAPVQHEAKRSILNGFATALGGCREPAIAKTLAVLGPYSSGNDCTVIGRMERADKLLAAQLNAMAANIADFDDTHPATVIHPTAPVAPALFALSETTEISGAALLRAFILGAEIECRLGNAVSSDHYARGWHITSTCGVIGSAVAVGALVNLTPQQLGHAISHATAQAAGMVETLGTMSKSISVGNAARNGIVSALLAQADFTGPPAPLEGTRGFLPVYADQPNMAALTDELGSVWEIAKNTYKPYPVGVVLNPVVEACLTVHAQGAIALEDVSKVVLTGHPLLRERTDRPDVETGREAQISAQHAIAITLKHGRAGLAEFSDAAVAETAGVRPPVTFIDDASYHVESARIVFHMRSGETRSIDIDDTRGGSKNPLSDEDLDAKLQALAIYGGFGRDPAPLADALWNLDQATDAGHVMAFARPL